MKLFLTSQVFPLQMQFFSCYIIFYIRLIFNMSIKIRGADGGVDED